MAINQCLCCGSYNLAEGQVLWKSLIDEWRLASYEVDYINRQQGLHCTDCQCKLRSMALAQAIMRFFSYSGIFSDFVEQHQIRHLRVLEINEAAYLTSFLSRLPGHVLTCYPDSDMSQMNFPDMSFDVVVHSDTLEHVAHPIRALGECYRILKPGGCCVFTIPMIVDRLTISRAGMSPSYHGEPAVDRDDYLVHTEYGCDAWKHIILAGFRECRIFSLEYPAAQAFVAVR